MSVCADCGGHAVSKSQHHQDAALEERVGERADENGGRIGGTPVTTSTQQASEVEAEAETEQGEGVVGRGALIRAQ